MKKRIISLLLAAAMTFSLTACGGNSSDDKKEETKTENTDNKETPEVDTIHWARANSGNILVTIAKQQGYFDEVGINVIEDPVESSTAALQALQAGQVDVTSNQGTNNPLQFISTGSDFSIVGGYMLKGMYIIGKKDTQYKDVTSLKGSKFAYAGVHPVVGMALLDAGIDPNNDVEWLTYSTNSEETTRVLDPYHVHVVIDRLAAVREAVGPDVDIIMENHSYIDAQVAVQLGEQAKKYNILFFEEPTTPNPKMNKFVCDKLNIPIAQGERIYSRWGYAPYFEDGSIQLIQPDIGNCGGLTEAKKICDLAHIYDVGVQAHVCASPLSTAVALQLEAAIPNFTIHEHHVYNRYDYNKKLCKYDYQPVDGYITVPDLPGIGNELTDYCFTNGKVTTIE